MPDPEVIPHPNTIRGPIEEEHNAIRDAREKQYVEDKRDLEDTYHEDLADIKQAKQDDLVAAGLNPDGGIPSNYGGPHNTVAPAITGTAQVGQTLTCDNGTWSPTPNSYAKQWYADAVAIDGATAGTYIPAEGDIGKAITCRVTATNGFGSASKLSNTTADVIAA